MKKVRINTILLIVFMFLLNTQFVNVCAYSSKTSKEKTVYITKTGKKYHKSNCKSLIREKTEIQLSKAKSKGYLPCKICKP